MVMSLNPLVSETIVATIFLIKETRKLGEFHDWRRKVVKLYAEAAKRGGICGVHEAALSLLRA
jgi:hypothetical protein